MVARHFYVTLQQVIRSTLILLFPIAFITLFAWATAGSTYGTTSDPLRAAVWLWLGAHLTPFNILSNDVDGYLSFLPIGALIFPWLSIRSGFNRSTRQLASEKICRAYFIINYILIYILLAISSINMQVRVDWLRGVPILIVILILATTKRRIENLVKLPFYLFLTLIGLSGLIFSLSLALNFTTAKNLTIVIQPGILGGLLLIILQILYLPNIFFATFSYLIGAGFSFGSGTYISPFVFDLLEIPAIPALAAIPTSQLPLLSLFSISILIISLLTLNQINQMKLDKKSIQQLRIRFLVSSVVFIGFLAWISSGELLSENMSPVGVDPLKISAVISGNLLLSIIILYTYRKIFNKKRKQG
jgi:hypothetical protein